MEKLEILRHKLYQAIEADDKRKIQSLSNQLDKEILKVTPRPGKKYDQPEQSEALG